MWSGIMTDAFSSPSPGNRRRILSLVLPCLPTDRHHRQALGRSWREPRRGDRSAPLVIAAKVKNALRLAALDETAERLGLTRGMPLADARAMIPGIDVADDDPAADAALLAAVADWAERYTPLVALDPPAGLMLDITGCAHLFGGEAALLADLSARLHAQGFLARAAIADTPGAASAAARYGAAPCIVPPGSVSATLMPLPLAALRLDPETVSALDRVGLKRIGQIMGLPRAPLAARFGILLIRRLDQALGIDEEAIDPRRPAPSFIAERRFAEPIGRDEDIAIALSSLAKTLRGILEARSLGARLIELALFRVDGAVARIAVGTGRPVREPERILALFREKFRSLGDELDAGFGFDMARLSVRETAPADPAQVDLSGKAVAEADLDGLIDRIAARLGPDIVGRIVARDSHIPERTEDFIAGNHASGMVKMEPVLRGEMLTRPLRLFARPEPVEDAVNEVPDGPPVRFRWRRALYHVARAEGPERIAPEWWRDDALTRDYFQVEDSAGHRFWLYREGLYGRETEGTPRWYLHGVFA
jgi:protein ImuB